MTAVLRDEESNARAGAWVANFDRRRVLSVLAADLFAYARGTCLPISP